MTLKCPQVTVHADGLAKIEYVYGHDPYVAEYVDPYLTIYRSIKTDKIVGWEYTVPDSLATKLRMTD